MRIWQIINYGKVSLCYTKFSRTENKDLYGHQLGELNFRSWESRVKGITICKSMKGKYFNLSNLTGGQLVETVYLVNK